MENENTTTAMPIDWDKIRKTLQADAIRVVDVKDDTVNHPKHYISSNGIEVMDVIEGFVQDPETWHMGNVIKYILRWRHKNGLEDLKKARVYLNHLIECVEKRTEKEEAGI